MNLLKHLQKQQEWSRETFGPGLNTKRNRDHIEKELDEIEKKPLDIEERIDLIILAFDGALRLASPIQVVGALMLKTAKNMKRTWPDWRTADPDKAIEHVRGEHD
tara:strand:- start:304 stop:618 length:315 start_codon:yes stop_codon:yes gene_type:complete